MYRGVGSQLLYNRQSHLSFFVGALTSNRFLTVSRLHVGGSLNAPQIQAFEVDSTGTTELTKENSLKQSPPEDQIELGTSVAPGASLDSEKLLFGVSRDYHAQLETYGSLIRVLHHAGTSSSPPMGWWSWTAYYFGLNQGTALTNAHWLAQHLKSLGYQFFHIDVDTSSSTSMRDISTLEASTLRQIPHCSRTAWLSSNERFAAKV